MSSRVAPPPKKKGNTLVNFYKNFRGKRDVSNWSVKLTGALPDIRQSVQNPRNQQYARTNANRSCYFVIGAGLVVSAIVIIASSNLGNDANVPDPSTSTPNNQVLLNLNE